MRNHIEIIIDKNPHWIMMKESKWQNYDFCANYPFKVQTNPAHMLATQTFTNTAICCSDPLLLRAIIPI